MIPLPFSGARPEGLVRALHGSLSPLRTCSFLIGPRLYRVFEAYCATATTLTGASQVLGNEPLSGRARPSNSFALARLQDPLERLRGDAVKFGLKGAFPQGIRCKDQC